MEQYTEGFDFNTIESDIITMSTDVCRIDALSVEDEDALSADDEDALSVDEDALLMRLVRMSMASCRT